ncbi:PhnB protein [Burkholderiales bacterium 8X]|nr:PhnB protein [Burkholderiales bacterium 8X]
MQVQPYLMFDGRCEEALEFYRQSIGAEIKALMRFKDNPDPSSQAGCQPGAATDDKIMHASFVVGQTEILASDGRAMGRPVFQGVSLALTADDVASAERLFGALAEGGLIEMPMMKTFFSPAFGMATDRFGVSWMVLAER